MQGNRKPSLLLRRVKIFNPDYRMCIDQCSACCNFCPCCSFQVLKYPLFSPFSQHVCSMFPSSSCNHLLFDRQESVRIKTSPGAAKVIGTVVCVGGAMLLSFYRGQTIELGESGIHWKYAELMRGGSSSNQGSSIWGSLCLIISSVAWAAWFVIQVSVPTSLLLTFLFSEAMFFPEPNLRLSY